MAVMTDSVSVNQVQSAIAPLCFVPREVSVKSFSMNDCITNAAPISPFEAYDVQFYSTTGEHSCCIQTPESSFNCCEIPKMSPEISRKVPGSTSCFFLELALKRIYPKEDFEILESLGEGFFGNVYKVQHKNNGEVMVLKMGKNRESRIRAKSGVLKEVATLNQLISHPNLIAFRGVCVDLSEGMWDLHILVDYCNGGSLNRLINDLNRPFSWKLRYMIARDISAAMKYVHSKNVMHRDLTSMNVLLQATSRSTLKGVVADFGLSCRIPEENEFLMQVGTPYWMAPECLKEEFYNEKADIFSFGIILCQMIARIEADPEAGLYRTNNFGLDYVRFANHCKHDTPLDILQLAFQCCLLIPSNRPSFVKIFDRLESFLRSYWNGSSYSRNLFVQSVYEDSKLSRSMSDAAFFSVESDDFLCTSTATDSLSEFDERDSQNGIVLCSISDDKLSMSVGETYSVPVNPDVLDRKSQIVELARSIAIEETSETNVMDEVNPFMSHQVYKSIRKIAPSDRKPCSHNFPIEKHRKIEVAGRRKNSKIFSSKYHLKEGETKCGADTLRFRKSTLLGWNKRRSFSYPCALQSPRKVATSTLPRHTNLNANKAFVNKKDDSSLDIPTSFIRKNSLIERSSTFDEGACEISSLSHESYDDCDHSCLAEGIENIASQALPVHNEFHIVNNRLLLARELNSPTPASLSDHSKENSGVKSPIDLCSRADFDSLDKVETVISSSGSPTRLPSLMCSVRRSCRRRRNERRFDVKSKVVRSNTAANGCSFL